MTSMLLLLLLIVHLPSGKLQAYIKGARIHRSSSVSTSLCYSLCCRNMLPKFDELLLQTLDNFSTFIPSGTDNAMPGTNDAWYRT
jgi:hypothetical protein